MKRILLNALLLLAGSTAFAQLQVSTNSLDLEKVNKVKGWQFGEAGFDSSTGGVFIKFKQNIPDETKTHFGEPELTAEKSGILTS